MVQKSGVHQLSLVVYPIIYGVLGPSHVVVWDVLPSTVYFRGGSYWEDHPMTCKWKITMVIVSPLSRVVGPLPNGRTLWLRNGGDPNHLRPSWDDPPRTTLPDGEKFGERWPRKRWV